MKRYLDTSVVVSFFIREVHTAAVRDWLMQDIEADNIISEWTITEFHSALSLKLCTGQISSEIKLEAEEFLGQSLKTIFKVISVSSIDFARAAELASKPELWLRAGDALNLAIAEREGAILSTVDKRLFAAAGQVGIDAHMP